MNTHLTYDVCVIGGGISGLTAAYHLHKRGENVLVLERNTIAGGVLQAIQEQGFTFDCAANTVRSSDASFMTLVRELELESSLVQANNLAKQRLILRDGTLHALTPHPFSLLRSPLLSLQGKMRLLKEAFIKPCTGNDETIADFMRRRLGAEVLEYLVSPVIAGIYAASPDCLRVRPPLPASLIFSAKSLNQSALTAPLDHSAFVGVWVELDLPALSSASQRKRFLLFVEASPLSYFNPASRKFQSD
jgi:protoporphyrinogen oxidase